MPPPWQIDAVETQLKHLEMQRNFLSSIMENIDVVLQESKGWIAGREQSSSFIDICQSIEGAFNDASDKVKEFAKEQNVDKTVNLKSEAKLLQQSTDESLVKGDQKFKEELTTTKDFTKYPLESYMEKMSLKFEIIEEAVSSLRKKTQEISRKQVQAANTLKECTSKVFSHCDKMENISKRHSKRINSSENKLKLLEQDIKKLQENEADVFSKIDDIIQEKIKFSETVACMGQEIDLLNSRVEILNMTVQEECVSASPLKNEVDNFSLILKELDTDFQDFSQKQCEISKTLQEKTFNIEALFGIVCQLLNKRLTPLEQLRTAMNKTVSDDNLKKKKFDEIDTQVSDLEKQLKLLIATLETKNIIGFTAMVAGSQQQVQSKDNFVFFEDVRVNTGNHFNKATGIFTTPSDGLYMIGIVLKNKGPTVTYSLIRTNSEIMKFNYFFLLSKVTVKEKTTDSIFMIEQLSKDSQLKLSCDGPGKLDHFSSFTCFRLN